MKSVLFLFKLTIILFFAASCNETANSQETKNQYIINISFEEKISYANVDRSAFILGGPDGWGRDTTIVTNIHDTITAINYENAYLYTYNRVCQYHATKAPMAGEIWNEEDDDSPDVEYRLKKVEILNSENKNILPKIDFPERKEKEDMIWREAQYDFLSYKDIPQPRIK